MRRLLACTLGCSPVACGRVSLEDIEMHLATMLCVPCTHLSLRRAGAGCGAQRRLLSAAGRARDFLRRKAPPPPPPPPPPTPSSAAPNRRPAVCDPAPTPARRPHPCPRRPAPPRETVGVRRYQTGRAGGQSGPSRPRAGRRRRVFDTASLIPTRCSISRRAEPT